MGDPIKRARLRQAIIDEAQELVVKFKVPSEQALGSVLASHVVGLEMKLAALIDAQKDEPDDEPTDAETLQNKDKTDD